MVRALTLLLLITVLLGCSGQDPVKLGFVGGLTGRASDLGSQSRNGMILAVEEWNQNGGIHGKPIETVIRDDKQNPERLIQMVQELIDLEVDAFIGPSTSAMAVLAAPMATEAQIPMFGTTVTTNELSNIDDYFFRTVAATKESTRNLAERITSQSKIENYALVSDLSNQAYTDSWKSDFIASMDDQAIEKTYEQQFTSGDNLALLAISQQLALIDADLVVLVTNATDSALLIKQIRSINSDAIIVTCEWAGTSQLLQLAGQDAEGVYVPRYINSDSSDAEFLKIKDAYESRFQQDLGYPGLLAYNATHTVLRAIAEKNDTQSIKEYLLEKRVHSATLADFELNEFGDEIRDAFHFVTRVEDGKFRTQTK
jgi:branched-chain amino acid transport system substrate-binding protein